MSSSFERILGAHGGAPVRAWPLHDVAQTRAVEAAHPGPDAAGNTLMQHAGLALARLTLALAPHACRIWVACGPGNNGGDGLEAAAHLQRWGKLVVASLAHDPRKASTDAQRAWQAASQAGVTLSDQPPAQFDICVDALFGIGALRPLQGVYAEWVAQMNASDVPTVAVDIPSGLDADTGTAQELHVRARHTLSLLTLKPGLFTGAGRDACGDIWFNDLTQPCAFEPIAWLQGPPAASPRPHASHKGSYGDACIIGGAPGMRGAALLAARSALHGGAGRVLVCPLGEPPMALDPHCPELMFRVPDTLDFGAMAVVAGCGGGQAIAAWLPRLLNEARHLVLDADALNRIAEQAEWQRALARRSQGRTVLTPHPLEAARLLGVAVAAVQADRLAAARALADRYSCVVVLKGSGTIVAAPGATPGINPTGSARLASAGTGDVLAGLVGALLANGLDAIDAARTAVWRHGTAAEQGTGQVLAASDLCRWA